MSKYLLPLPRAVDMSATFPKPEDQGILREGFCFKYGHSATRFMR
jgi:hypothetical protein